jgi:hypothetical protein
MGFDRAEPALHQAEKHPCQTDGDAEQDEEIVSIFDDAGQ